MKTQIALFLIIMAAVLITASCKKDDPDPSDSGMWDLVVKNPEGDTFVIATGDFTFTTSQFTADVTTSRIGGGDIVKQFEITGIMEGDSMIVEDFFFSLTDPAEDVVLNGKIGVTGNSMNGSGTYSIVQPPDSLYYYGSFLVKGDKK